MNAARDMLDAALDSARNEGGAVPETVEVPVWLLERVLDAYDFYTDHIANDEPHAAHYEAQQLRRRLPEPADPDAELVEAMAAAMHDEVTPGADSGMSPSPWERSAAQDYYRRQARAALAAYREAQQ